MIYLTRRATQVILEAKGKVKMLTPYGKGKFVVKSKKGKNLSRPLSKSAAKKRLSQVEYFKRKGKGK